jgi:hypothetical protein
MHVNRYSDSANCARVFSRLLNSVVLCCKRLSSGCTASSVCSRRRCAARMAARVASAVSCNWPLRAEEKRRKASSRFRRVAQRMFSTLWVTSVSISSKNRFCIRRFLDLAVVLIDAGSTITEEDLSTIRALYEAGVPVSVLLSKSDLLTEDDRRQSLAYVSQQIRAQLGLELYVYPVSVQPTHAVLIEDWLKHEIFSLYAQHQQLMQESLRRKIGSLRGAVETAMRIRLEHAPTRSDSSVIDIAGIDAQLRGAVGYFAEARRICSDITHEIEDFAERGLAIASSHLIDKWLEGNGVSPTLVVHDALVESAMARASFVFGALEGLARELAETLQDTARDLGFKEVHNEGDLISTLNEMPRLDLGTWEINLEPSFLIKLSKQMAARRIEQRLHEQVGAAVSKAFYSFGKMLDDWVRRTLTALQLRFDTYADGYRAHLDRLTARGRISQAEEVSIRRDLDRLAQPQTSGVAKMTPPS